MLSRMLSKPGPSENNQMATEEDFWEAAKGKYIMYTLSIMHKNEFLELFKINNNFTICGFNNNDNNKFIAWILRYYQDNVKIIGDEINIFSRENFEKLEEFIQTNEKNLRNFGFNDDAIYKAWILKYYPHKINIDDDTNEYKRIWDLDTTSDIENNNFLLERIKDLHENNKDFKTIKITITHDSVNKEIIDKLTGDELKIIIDRISDPGPSGTAGTSGTSGRGKNKKRKTQKIKKCKKKCIKSKKKNCIKKCMSKRRRTKRRR